MIQAYDHWHDRWVMGREAVIDLYVRDCLRRGAYGRCSLWLIAVMIAPQVRAAWKLGGRVMIPVACTERLGKMRIGDVGIFAVPENER